MNNIFKIPAFQRRKAIPKQLKDLELLPLNEQFSKLTISIVGDDDLRPVLTGNFFDMEKKKIVSTDAHKMTAINMPNETFDFIAEKYNKELDKEPKGLIFHTLSQLQKDYNKLMKNNNITISFDEFINDRAIQDGRYPNFESVFPKEFTNEINVDYQKLYWYAKVLLDAKVIDDVTKINTSNANEYQNKKIEYLKDSYTSFLNPVTKQIILTYLSDDGTIQYIGFNARLVCDLLKFAMDFNGKSFGKVGISGNNRGMVVELENGLNVSTDSVGLVMPVMLVSGQFDNTIGDSDFDLSVAMYYDLDTNSIISDKVNYPINESIGFMPNKANLSTPNIRVKEEVSKVENSSADLIDILTRIKGYKIALKVAKEENKANIEKKIKGLEIAKRMKKDDLPFKNGGRVGNSEIEIATLYGKMLNQLGKEKQFNKKFEKKVELDKFSKSNGITIDNNNIISINGIRVAFIDKINQKTGQEKSNWEIKKFNKGGNVDEDISWDITIRDEYDNETFEINVRGYFENEEDAIKQAIKDYDIYVDESDYGKMYWNGNEITIYGAKKNYKKGGNVKNGINWYKYDGQYEAEFGNFFLYISPSTQRGYYNFRVTDGYRGDTISESQQEILGLDNAKELAIDIVGDYMKQFKKGGSIGFKGLSNKVASNYEGKKVPQRFQSIYGKTYSQSEAQEVGNKVAGKVYREQQANKMAKGGMVEFYDYKGVEIMYEPTYEEYFVNDLVFNSLEKAHKYIDSGEANKTPTYIENLYRRGAMSKGGGVGMNKSYNNPENAIHVLHIDNQNWYLEKIDSTHFYMSNDPNFRGMAHHIGQHNGEIYYDEVKQWLKDTQYAKGGGVSSWNTLTIEKIGKNFPYKLNALNEILQNAGGKRNAKIYDFRLDTQSNKYDTFAQFVYSASIILNDAGSDSVTPSGTYFSKKSLPIMFYLRLTIRKDGNNSPITINASKDVAGGMTIYKSNEVNSLYEIENYINSILRDNPPNNLENMVYKDGGSVDEQTYIDLFEDYENIPAEVQMILDEYSESFEDGDYTGMSKAQNELEQIGYTFDFYVDGDAYGLRPMNVKLSQIQGYEDEDEE